MKRLSVILVSFLLYLPLCAQFKGTVSVDTNQSGIVDNCLLYTSDAADD